MLLIGLFWSLIDAEMLMPRCLSVLEGMVKMVIFHSVLEEFARICLLCTFHRLYLVICQL